MLLIVYSPVDYSQVKSYMPWSRQCVWGVVGFTAIVVVLLANRK